MSTQSLTIDVPDGLYRQLKQRAEQAQRTVEEETLEVLFKTMPEDTALPADLQQAVQSLEGADDQALWEFARTRLTNQQSEQLEVLHTKQRHERLNDAESQSLAALVRLYERQMLVRAKAAALLKARSQDISKLLKP